MNHRYVEVTHTYIIPVPDEERELDPAELDPVMNAGVSMMEGFIKQHGTAVLDLRSDWKLLPREFVPKTSPRPQPPGEITYEKPKITDLPMIQAGRPELGMEPGQVSLTRDIFGQDPQVTHPWDQGLRILPLDHEGALLETAALKEHDRLCGERDPGLMAICIGVKGHQTHGVDHTWWPVNEGRHVDG